MTFTEQLAQYIAQVQQNRVKRQQSTELERSALLDAQRRVDEAKAYLVWMQVK